MLFLFCATKGRLIFPRFGYILCKCEMKNKPNAIQSHLLPVISGFLSSAETSLYPSHLKFAVMVTSNFRGPFVHFNPRFRFGVCAQVEPRGIERREVLLCKRRLRKLAYPPPKCISSNLNPTTMRSCGW